jgi:SAM-dependent methyltransferase
MTESDALLATLRQQAEGATQLNLAFIGVANGLFDALAAEAGSPEGLAARLGYDPAYLRRWCDAAYAFGLLDGEDDALHPSPMGALYRSGQPGWAMAAGGALSAHMAERVAGLMRTGERPGEALLEEKASIAALFGPMLEQGFSPMLGGPVLRAVPVFQELLQNDALVIDLGCGNGWYLRVLAQRFPALRGLGIDGMAENIDGATASAEAAGLSARLRFLRGDVLSLGPTEPATLIAMNRALHHVWDRQSDVMAAIFDRLKPGGAAVIWEPAWPADPRSLRTEGRPGITWNNILEHAQGNHLLRPDEIAAAAAAAGLVPTIHPVGFDVVVVARRPA